MHRLPGITFEGPPLTKTTLLTLLPEGLVSILSETNGFVAFRGGLHVRGICEAPEWHSLEEAWIGGSALHKQFPALLPTDIPFAQDCLGDQFVVRRETVHKLCGETGELDSLEMPIDRFFELSAIDPVEFLQLHPLLQFEQEGGKLEPGMLLSAYPPFVAKESENGVSLRAVSLPDRISFLADLARQLSQVTDGEVVKIQLTP